jgi:hypothetical protein
MPAIINATATHRPARVPLGLDQHLHGVQREEQQCGDGERPFGVPLEPLEPGQRGHQPQTLVPRRVLRVTPGIFSIRHSFTST